MVFAEEKWLLLNIEHAQNATITQHSLYCIFFFDTQYTRQTNYGSALKVQIIRLRIVFLLSAAIAGTHI